MEKAKFADCFRLYSVPRLCWDELAVTPLSLLCPASPPHSHAGDKPTQLARTVVRIVFILQYINTDVTDVYVPLKYHFLPNKLSFVIDCRV